jgi:hypothetical protein
LKMGSPAFPSREQQDALRKAAQMPVAKVVRLSGGETSQLSIQLASQGLALIQIAAHNAK